MKLTIKDKVLIRQIAEHFKFTVGDALAVFDYAKYKSKTKNTWLKGKWKNAVSIEKCRELTRDKTEDIEFAMLHPIRFPD